MSGLRRLAAWTVALVSLGSPATTPPAMAQPAAENDETADRVFAAARKAFQAGDYEGAAELFRRANVLRPSANTTFNEAQSWRRAGKEARAADAYATAAKAEGLDDELAAAATRQLSALREQLGQLALSGPDDGKVSVAHVEGASLPHQLHLAPGKHELRLIAPDGRQRLVEVTVVAGETTELALTYPEAAAPELAPAPIPDQGPSTRWVLGWTALGVGAAGGVVAAILGARFDSVLGDYEAGGYVDTALEDEALRLRAATNGVAFSSAIIGVTGAILLLTTLDDEETSVSVHLAPTGAGMKLRF